MPDQPPNAAIRPHLCANCARRPVARPGAECAVCQRERSAIAEAPEAYS